MALRAEEALIKLQFRHLMATVPTAVLRTLLDLTVLSPVPDARSVIRVQGNGEQPCCIARRERHARHPAICEAHFSPLVATQYSL